MSKSRNQKGRIWEQGSVGVMHSFLKNNLFIYLFLWKVLGNISFHLFARWKMDLYKRKKSCDVTTIQHCFILNYAVATIRELFLRATILMRLQFLIYFQRSEICYVLLIQVLSSRFFVNNSGHHFIVVLGAFLNSLKNFIQPQQAWLGKMWTRGSRCVTIDFFLRQQRSYTSGQTLGLYWL